MPYPSVYTIAYNYTGFQQSQGNNSFPGTQLDADLNGLQASIQSIDTFMQNVVRSDGALQNGVVTFDSLSANLQTAGLAPASAWAAGTNYLKGNSVTINSNLYRCLTPHTSGVFANDLAAGNWTLVSALISGPQGPPGTAPLANPAVTIGLAAVNGAAATALRSDGAPALSQAIVPTWTGLHTFTATTGGILVNGSPHILSGYQEPQSLFATSVDVSAGSATVPENGALIHMASGVGSANLTTAFKRGLSVTVEGNSGSASVWGQTVAVLVGAGGTKRGGVGLEIDMNSFWGNYSGAPSNPYGANLVMTGQNTDGAGNGGYLNFAIGIEFAQNQNPMWNYGIHFGPAGFNPFNTAAIFDESNSPTSLKINGAHANAIIDVSEATTPGFIFKSVGFVVVSTGETLIGGAGVSTGVLDLAGVTSGVVKIQPQAAAGTYNFNLPTGAGSAGQPLLSGGGGVSPMTFGTLGVAGGGTGLATLAANTIYKGNGTGSLAASSITDDGTTFAINTNQFTVTLANGNTVAQGSLSAAVVVSSNEVRAAGDLGGGAGTNALTGSSSTTIGTGTGTVKMSSANAANNTGWIKFRLGTSVAWVPTWTTNAP